MPPHDTSVGILASAIHALESHPCPRTPMDPRERCFSFSVPEMPMGPRVALANLWLFDPDFEALLDRGASTSALIRTTFAPTMLEGSRKRMYCRAGTGGSERSRASSDTIDETYRPRHTRHRRFTGHNQAALLESEAIHLPSRRWIVDIYPLQRTITQQFPDAIVAPGLVLGATDSRHYQPLSDQIFRFLPIRSHCVKISRASMA